MSGLHNSSKHVTNTCVKEKPDNNVQNLPISKIAAHFLMWSDICQINKSWKHTVVLICIGQRRLDKILMLRKGIIVNRILVLPVLGIYVTFNSCHALLKKKNNRVQWG